MREEVFAVNTTWEAEKSKKNRSPKSHQNSFENLLSMQVSAAKKFKGDDTLLNPEQLLLAALASCHLMSYLYVCTTHKVELVHYDARTEGYLKLNADGAGSFSHAFIYPRVTIGFGADVQLAKDLHKKASQLCFISNSLNFKVEIFPEIIQKQEKVV